MDDTEAVSLETQVAHLQKLLHDERLHTGEISTKYFESLDVNTHLRAVLEDALTKLRQAYENLTAAQTAGTQAVLALQYLRERIRHGTPRSFWEGALDRSECLQRGDGVVDPRDGTWFAIYRPGAPSCGYPAGKSGEGCPKPSIWKRSAGPYLYSCDEHAR